MERFKNSYLRKNDLLRYVFVHHFLQLLRSESLLDLIRNIEWQAKTWRFSISHLQPFVNTLCNSLHLIFEITDHSMGCPGEK